MVQWTPSKILHYFQQRFRRQIPKIPPTQWPKQWRKQFIRVGNEFLKTFKKHCALKPTHHILEVGSGWGRIALPLKQYLTTGSYIGFDVNNKRVRWANKAIGKPPKIKFFWVDLHNQAYNRKGPKKSSTYIFPFQDRTFDFVCLISVFTHMLPKDMEQYLAEIARVLKKNGTCLITYFLINEASKKAIREKKSKWDLKHKVQEYRTANPRNPELVIGHPETFVKSLYHKNNLKIKKTLYGKWCRPQKKWPNQDIIIAVKK
jgi:ubiquinone/menaquinone biosynthesis C-methylase UbiE